MKIDDLLGERGLSVTDQWWQRTAAALRPKKAGRWEHYRREPVGFFRDELGVDFLTDDQTRFLYSIRDYEATVVKSATGTGKTFILGGAAIWLYKAYDLFQGYCAAAPPEDNLKLLLWGEISRFIQNRPGLFEEDTVSARMHIERAAKQFLTGVTIPKSSNDEEVEARFSGKHQRYMAFFFDEADAIPNPVFRGADGCMSGGEMVRMALCLNPRQKQGYPFELINESKANVITMSAMDHPNVRTGQQIVPGAVTQEATVRRINEWARPMRDDEEFTPQVISLPEFLEGATALDRAGREYPPLIPGYYVVIENQFFYKVLGEYPPAGLEQLFPDHAIDDARNRYDSYVALNGFQPPEGRPLMGLDVADLGDDLNSCCLRWGGFVKYQEWGGVDPDGTGDRAILIYKEYDVLRANIDSIGVGAGVAPKMARGGCLASSRINVQEKYQGHSEHGKFRYVRDFSYWELRRWLIGDPTAMLPNRGRLVKAMRNMTYTKDGSGYIVVESKKDLKKKIGGYSPDDLESLMLTFSPSTAWMGGI